MSYRIKKRKKIFTKKLGAGYQVVLRLFPLIRTQKGCVWLVGMAVAKSRRQINDWLNQRKNGRVRRLASSLTGKCANKAHAVGIYKLREWIEELPPGHSISFRCESANPEKQYRVWTKWFAKNETVNWEFSEEHRSFFYYKPKRIE